jgi:hypothetical protein
VFILGYTLQRSGVFPDDAVTNQIATSTAAAPGQAAGYFYQLRYALFRALKRLLRDPTGSIGIERLDDIAHEKEDSLVGIEQLKHTSTGMQQFTDSSPAIWRTVGNWSRLIQDNSLNLATLELFLVTNGSIADGSGLSKLCLDDRDPVVALVALRSAALDSQNRKSTDDRNEFLRLDGVVQAALIRAVRVVPNSPSLAALGAEIEDIIHYACEPAQLSDFRLELEGGWFDRVSADLSEGRGPLIPLMELDARVAYLREKYKTSGLQIDVEDPAEHPENLNDYLFVKQVTVLNVGTQRIRNAQRDFLKASAQRSKWLRQSRIDPAELNKYDVALEDIWSTQFAIFEDELSSQATEHEKCECGRRLLAWAETQQLPLRGASAQFLTSGSYHTLADQFRLGWHPEFKHLFEAR